MTDKANNKNVKAKEKELVKKYANLIRNQIKEDEERIKNEATKNRYAQTTKPVAARSMKERIEFELKGKEFVSRGSSDTVLKCPVFTKLLFEELGKDRDLGWAAYGAGQVGAPLESEQQIRQFMESALKAAKESPAQTVVATETPSSLPRPPANQAITKPLAVSSVPSQIPKARANQAKPLAGPSVPSQIPRPIQKTAPKHNTVPSAANPQKQAVPAVSDTKVTLKPTFPASTPELSITPKTTEGVLKPAEKTPIENAFVVPALSSEGENFPTTFDPPSESSPAYSGEENPFFPNQSSSTPEANPFTSVANVPSDTDRKRAVEEDAALDAIFATNTSTPASASNSDNSFGKTETESVPKEPINIGKLISAWQSDGALEEEYLAMGSQSEDNIDAEVLSKLSILEEAASQNFNSEEDWAQKMLKVITAVKTDLEQENNQNSRLDLMLSNMKSQIEKAPRAMAEHTSTYLPSSTQPKRVPKFGNRPEKIGVSEDLPPSIDDKLFYYDDLITDMMSRNRGDEESKRMKESFNTKLSESTNLLASNFRENLLHILNRSTKPKLENASSDYDVSNIDKGMHSIIQSVLVENMKEKLKVYEKTRHTHVVYKALQFMGLNKGRTRARQVNTLMDIVAQLDKGYLTPDVAIKDINTIQQEIIKRDGKDTSSELNILCKKMVVDIEKLNDLKKEQEQVKRATI